MDPNVRNLVVERAARVVQKAFGALTNRERDIAQTAVEAALASLMRRQAATYKHAGEGWRPDDHPDNLPVLPGGR